MIRPCIRLCSIAAIRAANTLAQQRVFDSDNSPLLEALQEAEASPYITVYTDDDTAANIVGMDIATADRTILLVLEYGVASKVVVEGSNPPTTTLEIAPTDEGMELILDMLDFQIGQALWQDVNNKWGLMLRHMCSSLRRIPKIRGAMADKGVRYAMRQVIFHIGNPVADPIPGFVPDGTSPIRQFIDEAKADQTVGMVTAATLLEGFLSTTTAPTWRQVQSWLGLTEQGIRGSGAGPLVMTDPDQEGATLAPAPNVYNDQGGIHLEQEDDADQVP